MAKQPSAFGGSRALGYQESYFANRNDMLQSALDAVLLTYDDEMKKYEAAVELYKDASATVDKERARLLKLRDDLVKEQIKGSQAAQQFNAGQLNSSARTGASIQATNARFNAKQAALAAYFNTQAYQAAGKGADDVLMNEARQAYTGSPTDINAGMTALGRQYVQTTEVPKTAAERDIGRAALFQQYLGDEVRKEQYSFLDPQDQLAAAADNLLAGLSAEDRASVERGIVASQQRAAGRGATLATEGGAVTSGGIPTTLVGEPSYLELIADVDKRLARVQEAQQAAIPQAPEKPDLIKAQRDEYFRTFFPGYTPAYQLNKTAESFFALPEDEKQAMINLFKSRTDGTLPTLNKTMREQQIEGFKEYLRSIPSDRQDPENGIPYEKKVEMMQAFIATLPPKPVKPTTLDMLRDELVARGKPQENIKVDIPEDYTRTSELNIPMEGYYENKARLETEDEILTSSMQELAIAQEELRSAVEQNDPEMVAEAQVKVDKANAVLDRALMSATATREQVKVEGEIREANRPFVYPIEKRGGENVPFFRKPGGRADVRAVEKRLDAEQRDKQFKIETAEEAKRLYGTPDFDRLLASNVGKEVSELYESNKAKGDESNKELLTYIAKAYPREKDQRTAAVVFYGLGYGDKKSGYLGGEEKAPAEPSPQEVEASNLEQPEELKLGGKVVPAEE